MPKHDFSLYGYCPKCGAPGVQRERRFNGDDKCENGHSYPSASSINEAGDIVKQCNCKQQCVECCKVV